MPSLFSIFLVGTGGALGSVLRFFGTTLIDSLGLASYSLGTVFVNLVGSFVAGVVVGIFGGGAGLLPPEQRVFLLSGLLGGFTTFSAFSVELVGAIREGNYRTATAIAAITVVGSMVACLLGVIVGLSIFNRGQAR